MTIQSLVINLKSAGARMAFQQEQLLSMGIPWKRMPAVTIDDIRIEANDIYWDGWQRPLAPTERACLLSHMACWQIVLDNSTPYLILEDDALLADDLPAVLAAATQIKDFDLLQLETRNRAKHLEKKTFDVGPVQARALLIDRTGAAGYVLWPTGAKKTFKSRSYSPGACRCYNCKTRFIARCSSWYPLRLFRTTWLKSMMCLKGGHPKSQVCQAHYIASRANHQRKNYDGSWSNYL